MVTTAAIQQVSALFALPWRCLSQTSRSMFLFVSLAFECRALSRAYKRIKHCHTKNSQKCFFTDVDSIGEISRVSRVVFEIWRETDRQQTDDRRQTTDAATETCRRLWH